jgi:hypothetical protein
MPFKRGDPKPPNSGRRPGVPNRRAWEIKYILLNAAMSVGGQARLVEWIKESPQNEYAFWTNMLMRTMPVRVEGQGPHGEIEMNVTLRGDDLTKQLEDRGLPTLMFGTDKPVLELEVVKSTTRKGNGRDDDDDQ